MFFNRTIKPNLKKTSKVLSFSAVQPSNGDYAMVGIIALFSIPLSWYTTKNWHYALLCCVFYWILAYSLIDDDFLTIIDKEKNEISVTKRKTGRVKWMRVSPADELVNIEIITIVSKAGTPSYRLELEFMSEVGCYYRLETAETLLLGEENRKELEKLLVAVRKFMSLKTLPKEFTEEELQKTMPVSMKKEERDKLRKRN